jgi:hypothetical protein
MICIGTRVLEGGRISGHFGRLGYQIDAAIDTAGLVEMRIAPVLETEAEGVFDKGMRLHLMFRCVNVYEIDFSYSILSVADPSFVPECC